MKALIALLLLIGVQHTAFACNWVADNGSCSYAVNHDDGVRWTATECDDGCYDSGKIHHYPCFNTEGTCLPPGVNPQTILAAGNNCGPWYLDDSDSNQCSNGFQWTRQWECVRINGDLNQYVGCSPSSTVPPADH